jgi:2-hydroxy-3-oxopropionate reductase
MDIGFIGLGIMGRPMARHLLSAGHRLALVERTSPPPVELLDGGATVLTTAAEVARQSEVVITIVPDTPDVEQVLFGPDGVAEGLDEGKLVIDMSSIDPIATRRFAERIGRCGADYLDAPVSGGEVGAKSATLTIMCGGAAAAFERARPLFEKMGKNITHVGDVGAGQVAKVANQIIVALNIEAVAEALVFAAKAGADPAKVREALLGGFASSKVLEVHGERMIKRTFDPGFRIELHQKDLGLALGSARELGLALPNTASTQQLFSACVASGGKSWDHSALVLAIEALGSFELGSQSS